VNKWSRDRPPARIIEISPLVTLRYEGPWAPISIVSPVSH